MTPLEVFDVNSGGWKIIFIIIDKLMSTKILEVCVCVCVCVYVYI